MIFKIHEKNAKYIDQQYEHFLQSFDSKIQNHYFSNIKQIVRRILHYNRCAKIASREKLHANNFSIRSRDSIVRTNDSYCDLKKFRFRTFTRCRCF